MPHHRLAIERRDPDARRIRRLTQQRGIELELPHQVGLAHALPRHREQHHAEQVDRRHAGGCIDARHDLVREVAAERREPLRLVLGDRLAGAPPRHVPPQDLVERQRFAETHVDLAEATAQLRQRLEHAEDRFLLLGPARQFADVGARLDDAFVAEVHRHEHDRPRRVAHVAAHRHREHADPRAEQAPGAAAAALDEVFDRMAAREDRAEVAREDRGVRGVAAEAAAEEKRAATAQERADDGHVEVDTGRDVRHRVALVIDDVRQQEVVHVAAVAGHVDDFAAFVDRFQAREIGELDAVVEAVPEPSQQAGHQHDEPVRIVRRDLVGIAARDLQRLATRELLLRHVLADRVAHGFRAQHVRNDRATVRQVRADRRGALVAELHAQLPPQPARPAGHAARFGERRLQRQRLAEQHEQVAAVDGERQQLAEASADVPVLGEQQPEP